MASEKRIYRLTYRVEIEVDAASEQDARVIGRDRLADEWRSAALDSVRDRGTADGDE